MANTPFVDRNSSDIDYVADNHHGHAPGHNVTEGMPTGPVDKFRQGVNVRDFRDFLKKTTYWLSDRGFPTRTFDRFDPSIETNTFGQPKLFKDPSPAKKPGFSSGPGPAPFDDIAKWNALSYMHDPGDTRYPIVLMSPNWLDPAQMDGIIEPLSIRQSMTNSSIDGPVVAHSIKASLQPESGPNILGQGIVISNFYSFHDMKSGDHRLPFIDSQNVVMSQGPVNVRDEGYAFPEPFSYTPFDDVEKHKGTTIDEMTTIHKNLSAGMFIDDPRLGIFGKSMTTGFTHNDGGEVYQGGTGSQWVNGTDSIAFGGLLK